MTGSLRLSVLVCGMALAQFSLAAGDPEAGMIKAETCLGCHGIENYKNVYPTFRVPKVAGQNADYLVIALKAYKSGERKHPTMVSQATTMTEQDMADIAAYFSSQSGGDE